MPLPIVCSAGFEPNFLAMRYLSALFRILFGIVLALGLFELCFRAITPASGPVRWSDRPNRYFLSESAASLQDGPHSATKPENTFRIVVVGDSFTFGQNVQFDDTFPKRLERWLNLNDVPIKVEVINAGVPGFSTHHEVALVEKAIRQQQADLVVLEITLNDAEIHSMSHEEEHAKFGADYLDKPIFSYWKSARFILERLHNSQTHRLYIQYFHDLYENPETNSLFVESLAKIAKISDESKVPVVAVVFPLLSFPMNNDGYPFRDIHEKINTLLEQDNIKHLDLFKFFLNIPFERLQVIPGADTHPNEIAHRIAAEAIYRFLKRSKLMPAEVFAKRFYKDRKDILSKSITPKNHVSNSDDNDDD